MDKTERNSVDHPAHYSPGKLECIDVMEDVFGASETMAFCKLCAFKYLYRAEHKGRASEDIDKAIWYLGKHQEISKRAGIESLLDEI